MQSNECYIIVKANIEFDPRHPALINECDIRDVIMDSSKYAVSLAVRPLLNTANNYAEIKVKSAKIIDIQDTNPI